MKKMKYDIERQHEEEKVHDDLLEHVTHLLNEHELPVALVASTLVAIGQRLYRTHLSDHSYHLMMDIIHDTPVEPYGVEKVRLH
jgi:hypothetical protein